MSEKGKGFVDVELPKALAEEIKKQPCFKYYRDVDDFVAESIRSHLFKLKKAETD